jgi:glycosyltransferase involved in cell wall biosynthesis
VSGTSGGVEQFVIGLAMGLSQLDDGDEEYLFLAYRGEAEWLASHLGSACRLLSDGPRPPATGSSWKRVARRVPLARRARDEWLPPVGPLRPRVPASSGRIEREGVDVMHLTRQDGFITTVPTIYHPHDLQHLHLPDYFTRRERAAREVTYRALSAQARIVAVASNWVRNDLIVNFGLDPDRIHVVPLAPPIQSYPEPSRADEERVRSALALPREFVLYPAQTWPHKNHVALLRALATVRRRHGLQVPLVCSGQTTAYLRTIQAHVDHLGLTGLVSFVGFASPMELVCLYRMCRAVVIPTMFEAASFPMFEAFALSAPVACSNVTSLPEQAGDAALLFDPESLEEIADAIWRLWTEPALREAMIARGHRRIGSRTWRDVARTFRAHYRWIGGRELMEEDRDLVSRSSTS